MDGYIVNKNNQWRLKPDIFSEILLEEIWFDPSITRLSDRREDYFKRLEADQDVNFSDCGKYFGRIWNKTNKNPDQNPQIVLNAISELYAISHIHLITQSLYQI